MTISSVAGKSADAFRTISEVAESLSLPQHVLRFWETRFTQIKPLKRAGGRRFYRPEDVELLEAIRQLLYGEGYTIKGVQRILREQGPRAVAALARGGQGAGAAPVHLPFETAAAAGDETDPAPEDIAAPVPRGPALPPREPTPPAGLAPLPWETEPAAEPVRAAGPAAAIGAEVQADLRAVLADIAFCRRLLDGAGS